MGQFKNRRSGGEGSHEEKPKIVLNVETKTDNKGRPYITLPGELLDELYYLTNETFYKIRLENKEVYTYYIEYKKRRGIVLSFSKLKPGKYQAIIEPYTLQDFLKEFNEETSRRMSLTLVEKTGY
ncbi:hypothetical protein JdFRA1000001_02 [uncultured archaeal virus]|uniref:Uncharacterized protein n=1 Tax=uncultured archaeal virus TaxID=1960247 RepID=A0A1S5Y2U2_9VIRU|nr:hypothetical protein JdFRA1000001_02 [uncultured archaeal virus]